MSENKIDTLTTLVEGLCAAMLDDEHGDGVDIAGGMYGEETSIWIKSVSAKIDKLTEHKRILREALLSLTQHYDSNEVAHHFGIDQDTAHNAVAALEVTKDENQN